MKRIGAIILILISLVVPAQAAQDEIGAKTILYFDRIFAVLKTVADKQPTVETYRDCMRPAVPEIEGLYGATLIDPDFVIRQVYFPSHFLARGFDLKKVEQLKDFYKMMKENPQPQLSEPGHGSIMQPALIAMRYPVVKDGKLTGIVSVMVRTETFLKRVGLDKCKAYRIICLGKAAQEQGKLSANYKEVKLELPSTQWLIQYNL